MARVRHQLDLLREYRATDRLLRDLRAHKEHLRQLLDAFEDERRHGRGTLDEAHSRESRHLRRVGPGSR